MRQNNETTLPDLTSSDRLLRAREAAELLGISVRTVWMLRSTGKLEAIKINAAIRFRASDIQRLVRQGAPS